MRKVIIFIMVFFLVTTELYAFSNSDFSVDEKGWNVKRGGDSVSFVLNSDDSEETPEIGKQPGIAVYVYKLEKFITPKYNEKELKDVENSVRNGIFKESYSRFEETLLKMAKEEKSNGIRAGKAKLALEELRDKSKITGSSCVNFGSYKAFKVDFSIASGNFSRYVIFAYNVGYSIDTYINEDGSWNRIEAFDRFKKSFKIKTSFGTLIHYYVGKYGIYVFCGFIMLIEFIIKKRKQFNF